ncbi:MAG: 4-hydroxy-tetrahydrodipicolinate synthase, partial [Oscillospiraceae bacterium]|nr:4-hydroxy-tetrahydrodipicolinate synthase [Oscillospiraceae bacterium]
TLALVVTPYYNKPSQNGIYKHFEAVSKVGIPVMVYNIAGRTGVNITTDTLLKIAALPNIIGVKEASGSIDQMMSVIATVKAKYPDFVVMSGDDSLTLPLISLGGDGVISVVSNLAPKQVKAMVDFALKGKFAEARKAHFALYPMFKAAFVDGNPSSIKCAMNIKGLPAGAVRAPLVDVTPSAKAVIKAALLKCRI